MPFLVLKGHHRLAEHKKKRLLGAFNVNKGQTYPC